MRDYIVLGVIRELFFDPKQGQRVETALKIFKRYEKDQKDDEHGSLGAVCVERIVTVKKVMEFMRMIDYVGRGISFRKESSFFTATATHTVLHMLREVHEEDVAKFVRAVVGINIQKSAYIMRHDEAWAFYIAFDGAKAQG